MPENDTTKKQIAEIATAAIIVSEDDVFKHGLPETTAPKITTFENDTAKCEMPKDRASKNDTLEPLTPEIITPPAMTLQTNMPDIPVSKAAKRKARKARARANKIEPWFSGVSTYKAIATSIPGYPVSATSSSLTEAENAIRNSTGYCFKDVNRLLEPLN